MSSSAAKKPKTTSEIDEEFEQVKRYLLECPHVSAEHPALKAALEGLENERKRKERDSKLQRKFAASTSVASDTASTNASVSAASSSMLTSTSTVGDDVVVIEQPTSVTPASGSDDPDEMMGWQDVGVASSKTKEPNDEGATSSSFLGEQLAKLAIDAISEHHVKVKSPTAAIALALHASLRSELLGFSCTGIPEDTKKGGFAAPIRELPKSKLLPQNWDSTSAVTTTSAKRNKVTLRYRKNGTGAMILLVQEEEKPSDASEKGTIVVQVTLSSTSSQEPSTQSLKFNLDEHVNLDSWNAAIKVSNSPVAPALHYKGLAMLLTKFCRSFDLGSIEEEQSASQHSGSALPYIDNTIAQHQQPPSTSSYTRKSDFIPAQYPPIAATGMSETTRSWEDNIGVPSTIDQAFPHARPSVPSGHFADDLAPAGLTDPRFGGPAIGNGKVGGNLMGPDHPMFVGGGGFGPSGGLPMGGPGAMQPRFDPVHPNIVYDPDGRGVKIPGPGRRLGGDPNPDHMPPPNSFGNDMFS